MRIFAKVVPRAGQNRVEQMPDGSFKIWTTAPPAEGKANQAVKKLMAQMLNRPKSKINIIRGKTGSHKVLEIL